MPKVVPIPNTETLEFKKEFIDKYSKLTDFEEFKKYSLSFLIRCIRVNTLKIKVEELKKRLEAKGWVLEQVPWCKEGFWIDNPTENRRDVGNLIEHSLGYFYVQEAASMIPPLVLDPKPGELVLDVAAAPGSKTTQIAQYMNNKGILISNDVSSQRVASLGLNVQRCGATNVLINKMDGLHIRRVVSDNFFDKILLDAPCSGTGTIRKSLKTIISWNSNLCLRMASLQKKLIDDAFNMLKPGGTLVYSTCTLEPEEDEGIISWLLEKYENADLEEIRLDLKKSKAILTDGKKEYDSRVKKTLRIWPQDNNTEGFFVAKIIKKKN